MAMYDDRLAAVAGNWQLRTRRTLDRSYASAMSHLRPMIPKYRDLAIHYAPTRGRFSAADPRDRGRQERTRIVNERGVIAAEIASAGMLSGMADPSRPWFELSLYRPGKYSKAVEVWLTQVRDVLLLLFDRSNFYRALYQSFKDELVFGTSVLLCLPDDETVFRFYTPPPGSYTLAQDATGRVHSIYRDTSMTVGQLVSEFGLEAVSPETQAMWAHQNRESRVEVSHAILPNEMQGRARQFDVDMPYTDVYWEASSARTAGGDETPEPTGTGWGGPTSSGRGILRVGGYEEFPAAIGRWARNDEDVLGTDCPGITALPATKMLQAIERTTSNAMEKQVDPPTKSGPGVDNNVVSHIAGENTIDPDMAQGGIGITRLYEVKYAIDQADARAEAVGNRIDQIFMVPFFVRQLFDDRDQRATATEVNTINRERVAVLGPIQENQADDKFDPIIDRAIAICKRASEPDWARGRDGLLPMPPDEIYDEEIRVQYVSEIAGQQKTASLQGIEMVMRAAAEMAGAGWPQTLDKVNPDKVIDLYAEGWGLAPEILNDEDETAQVRALKREQEEAMAQQAQMPGMARAAKDLSSVGPEGLQELAAAVGAA